MVANEMALVASEVFDYKGARVTLSIFEDCVEVLVSGAQPWEIQRSSIGGPVSALAITAAVHGAVAEFATLPPKVSDNTGGSNGGPPRAPRGARVRVRTDSWWDACAKRAVLLGARPDPRSVPNVNWAAHWLAFVAHGEEAQPGDVWVLRQPPGRYGTRSSSRGEVEGWPVIGYVLVCPKPDCPEGGHAWDHAYTCNDPNCLGCWTWTGSPEDGTLSASPSLHCVAERGGCGWHGWLRSGEMVG